MAYNFPRRPTKWHLRLALGTFFQVIIDGICVIRSIDGRGLLTKSISKSKVTFWLKLLLIHISYGKDERQETLQKS